MNDRDPLPAIRDLLPHAGLMCLLEEVVDWDDAQVLLATRTHLRADNPLRRAGRLDMLHLCEYGAQAMAVHGGLLAHREGRRAAPGLLVSLRDVRLAGGDLSQCAGALLASGRAAVVLRGG